MCPRNKGAWHSPAGVKSRRYVGRRLERTLTYRHSPAVDSKSEQYRRKADEADVLAKTTRDSRASEMYRDLANRYRELADQHDRMAKWTR